MFSIYGMRTLSLSTSVRLLRVCPFLAQKFPSSTFKEFNNFYSASWPSSRITKPTVKTDSLYFINPPAYYSTNLKSSRPTKTKLTIEKKILTLKTVEEQLEFFKQAKYLMDIVNKISILYNIAKIIERNEEQKQVVKQELNSTYMELLDNISIQLSRCLPQNMPAVMWAVGINQEKHQKLVYLCQKKILSRGAVFFNNESIYQILNGCANLHMTSTELFPKFQEAILNGEVKICDFEDHQLSGISLSFAKTDNGSVELFDALLEEILSRDFSMIECRALAEFVWSFAKNQLIADELFDRIEEEILRRGIPYLDKTDFIQILWAYGMTGKGSKQLFYSVDNELVSRGVERFSNVELLDIVWCFGKRNFTKATAFDIVKKELFNRGVCTLHTHELVLILLSFFSAQRHDDKLVTEIESELSSRNGRQIGNTHLCHVAWSLGRAGKSDSKMFDVTEAEVFRRGVFEFSKEEKFMLMRAFLEAKRGSKEFYELLYSSFSANDLSNFSARDIHEFAWCISEADVAEAGAVFDALEKEILKKEKCHFSEKQLTSIKKSFQKVGKGSKELFEF